MSSIQSFAGADGYLCTILEIQELGTSGKFTTHKGVFSKLIGVSFSIDRATGKVIGLPFSNASYKEIRVFDHGSTESGYKHIAISHPPNIWIQYVYVAEHEKKPEKPFWEQTMGTRYSAVFVSKQPLGCANLRSPAGSRYLCESFYGHPCPTSGKHYATAYAFGGPSPVGYASRTFLELDLPGILRK